MPDRFGGFIGLTTSSNDPQIALFQVGYRNRFRHPEQQVPERHQALGIVTLRNDEDGAIMLKFWPGSERQL